MSEAQEVLREVLERVRRTETRLCTLMEHMGMSPKSTGTHGVIHQPANVVTSAQEIKKE